MKNIFKYLRYTYIIPWIVNETKQTRKHLVNLHIPLILASLIINESSQKLDKFLPPPLVLGLSATLPFFPRLVIPFLSITEALPVAICISLRVQAGNFYHRFTLGPTAFHLPRPGNYYSRHRGCFRVSFHPFPPPSLPFTRVTQKGWKNWRNGARDGGGGGGKGFGWKVSWQFNFYDAPCHFYPSFCNGMQPTPLRLDHLSLLLFLFLFLSSFIYHTWYQTRVFEQLTIVEHSKSFLTCRI